MPIVFYIFSALFLYFGIYRFSVDPADAGISLMIALTCFLYGFLFHRDERQIEGLKMWIYHNRDELRKNGVMYNGPQDYYVISLRDSLLCLAGGGCHGDRCER